MRSPVRCVVWLSLTGLFGCGDDTSVRVCIGDPAFCALAFKPVAVAGHDQTVASGDPVTLDGSGSNGSIQSYSWAQTAGPTVALTNSDKARAAFVAPRVLNVTALTFRLTVVNDANQADSGSTVVTVQPPVTVALSTAVELFAGPLRPALSGAADPSSASGCPSATADLPPDQAAAQIGLWLAGRAIGIANGVEPDDPSDFLDVSRVLMAERGPPTRDVAGQLETFGFGLLGALAVARDPALHDMAVSRQQDAVMFSDPAGLLGGRIEVRHAAGIDVEPVADPVQGVERAVVRLLAARGRCVGPADALDLTAAGLRVIAAAPLVGG